MEQAFVGWFADRLAFPQGAGGPMTSGGSMANLIALTAARDHHLGPDARRKGVQGRSSPLVQYALDQVHSSSD